jgi:hypothetical protein
MSSKRYPVDVMKMSWNRAKHKEQIIKQLKDGTKMMLVAESDSSGSFDFYARYYIVPIQNELREFYIWVSNDERRRILRSIQ